MPVNRTRTDLWKEDVEHSVDFYNDWFMNFAPQAFRDARNAAITKVDSALIQTHSFCRIINTVSAKLSARHSMI